MVDRHSVFQKDLIGQFVFVQRVDGLKVVFSSAQQLNGYQLSAIKHQQVLLGYRHSVFLKGIMFNFEKLQVWNKAIDYADAVYALTRDFPVDERFGLTSQLRRAAVSISSNLAEGSSRMSRADFARFVELASGSLFETVSQCRIGLRQGFLSQEAHDRLYALAAEQGRMLSGLRDSLTRD